MSPNRKPLDTGNQILDSTILFRVRGSVTRCRGKEKRNEKKKVKTKGRRSGERREGRNGTLQSIVCAHQGGQRAWALNSSGGTQAWLPRGSASSYRTNALQEISSQ